ncbi:MAG: hypothetical protein MJ211_05525 [Bacteroidales bacterium]|nr:hypothetical protein [Bacteroidales bacterium]
MNKDQFLPFTAIAIALVSIAFAIICVAVFLTRGKSAFFINKKMKIGAYLIMLTSLVSCNNGCGGFETTCYDAVATSQLRIEDDTVNLSKTDSINCILINPTYEKFIYKIVDQNDSTIYQNEFSIDLANANFQQDIKLYIDKNINFGEYQLIVCDQTGNYILSEDRLIIKK